MTNQQIIQFFQEKGLTVRVLGNAPKQRIRIIKGVKSRTIYEEKWNALTKDEQEKEIRNIADAFYV